MEIVEVKIYKFEELSDDAKKNAIDKNRDFYDDILSENILEYYEGELLELGYPTDDICFDLGYCQGDGMAFYGDVDLEKILTTRVSELEEFGLDKHDLRRIKFLVNEGIEVKLNRNSYGYHYSHFNTMDVEGDWVENYAYEETNQKTLNALDKSFDKLLDFIDKDIRTVSKNLEDKGYNIIEHYTSDEVIEEGLIANEYDFYENGKMYS